MAKRGDDAVFKQLHDTHRSAQLSSQLRQTFREKKDQDWLSNRVRTCQPLRVDSSEWYRDLFNQDMTGGLGNVV